MDLTEFIEQVGRVVGVKQAKIIGARVFMKSNNHLNQEIHLVVVPTPSQAKKLRDLALVFGGLEEVKHE